MRTGLKKTKRSLWNSCKQWNFVQSRISKRGEIFVTQKITIGISRIFHGLQDCLYMGNIDALRDWGHAKDYVRMQWLMLQQDEPDDYVIATGKQHSVRQFIEWSAQEAGIEIYFEGSGSEEIGIVKNISNNVDSKVSVGDVILRIDPRYFRPTEVDSLLGDPSKAKKTLDGNQKFQSKKCVKR
ncbi:MAG: hypothetical protein CM15mP29_3580 [Alphaproteobacteria bacterium]|nr:MAG: hypothetical protein CM15mP29_3580 [Alphaproteobacteria bacterium]